MRLTISIWLSALLLILCADREIRAAPTKTWDGGGADSLWATGANWSGNSVPGSGNNVVFGSGFTSGTAIDLGGVTRTVGDITISTALNLDLSNGTLLAGGGAITRSSTSGNQVISALVTLKADTDISVAAGGDFTISGAIGETGGARAISKIGTGTLILSGNSSYTGTTTISAGTVIAGSNNALGTSAGTTVIATGASLGFQGGISYTTAENIASVAGTGMGAAGAVYNVSGNNSFAGTIAMTANTSFGASAGTLSLNGVISGLGGSWSFTKVGAGTIVLGAVNTFTGAIAVDGGTLSISSDSNLGNSANDITLNGGVLNVSANAALGSGRTVTMGAGGGTIDTSTSATLTLGTASQLSGSTSLTKTGAGTLIIGGDNSATFTGNTIINGGTVQIDAENRLGNLNNDVTIDGGTLNVTSGFTASSGKVFTVGASGGALDINSGQTLTLNTASQLSGSGSLTKVGSGTLLIGGNNSSSFTGTTIINAGTVSISAENNLGAAANGVTFGGGTLSVTAGFTANSGKVFTLNAGGGTLDIANGETLTLGAASQLSGSGNLTKAGSGTLVLSGDNSSTFTGNTIANAGILQISAENNLGAAGNDVTIDSATLNITSGFAASSGKVFTLGSGGGTLDITSGTMTLGTAGQLAGSGNLTKAGAGTLAISGDNSSSFSGNTYINAGTLQIGAENNLGAASSDVTFGGGTLAVTSGFTANSGKVFTFGSGGGTLDISSGQTLTIANASQITGSGNITKSGSGTVTIGGASGYSGNLNIDGGEFRVQGLQSSVDAFLTSSRLSSLGGAGGGILTFAYTDATAKDRVISSQPTVPTSTRLAFEAVNANHSYGLGASANDLANWGGLIIRSGTAYAQVNQTFNGNGSTPTTLDLQGGTLELFGGSSPATLTFSGKVTLSGGTLSGGGEGALKGTLATSGDVEITSSATLTGNPNITMQPGVGSTTRLYGTGSAGTLANFIKTGPGTVQVETTLGVSSQIDVQSGTLLLGSANRITDDSSMRLSGGTLGTGGFNEQLNTLTLSATSYIDLGASGSSILKFADSSGIAWTGGTALVIYNWSGSLLGGGTDQLYFGSTLSGLSTNQIQQIWFVNPAGLPASADAYAADILASGEVIPRPVPEPSVVAGMILLFGTLAFREGRTLRRWGAGLGLSR